VANQVARRVGTAPAVGGGITLVLAGLLLRGSGGGQVWSLYAGTVLAGAGIALAGTLLPGMVKTVFPATRSGLGTGLTMVAMMGLAAVASATAVPLADALGGWSASLLAWVPLARAGVCADVGAPSTHATRQPTTAAILTCIRLPKALITTEHTEVKHWDFLGGPGDLGG